MTPGFQSANRRLEARRHLKPLLLRLVFPHEKGRHRAGLNHFGNAVLL